MTRQASRSRLRSSCFCSVSAGRNMNSVTSESEASKENITPTFQHAVLLKCEFLCWGLVVSLKGRGSRSLLKQPLFFWEEWQRINNCGRKSLQPAVPTAPRDPNATWWNSDQTPEKTSFCSSFLQRVSSSLTEDSRVMDLKLAAVYVLCDAVFCFCVYDICCRFISLQHNNKNGPGDPENPDASVDLSTDAGGATSLRSAPSENNSSTLGYLPKYLAC